VEQHAPEPLKQNGVLAGAPAPRAKGDPVQQGDLVWWEGAKYRVQYVSSRGTLDLRAVADAGDADPARKPPSDEEVAYGVEPSAVTPVQPEGSAAADVAPPAAGECRAAPPDAAATGSTTHIAGALHGHRLRRRL
jgi:hypothetical protein